MSDHYAVCLSISQGAFDTQASANFIACVGQDETVMAIQWPVLPPQTDPENPGEWLFHILEDLVTNFDAHQVTSAERRPRGGFTAVPNAE